MGSFICIDLKSFYASVECVERGLDPFKVNLVVADPDRSKSSICLAITPAMKAKGVKNRCRMHEIPPNMEVVIAPPRMQLYIDYSSKIYSIYLKYAAPEDIHVYSIDECFIDVSNYNRLYGVSAKEIAIMMMDAVYKETGITATAGIGTNLYLAKIAMDIVAKHVDDHIGYLDEISFRKLLWNHRPITDFWMIGPGTAARLARSGIMTQGDLARASVTSEDWLYKVFGINAELLIDHAWGLENCTMADIKSYRAVSHSLSNSQILMRNYTRDEARVVIKEMTDMMSLEMVRKHFVTESMTISVHYDHKFGVAPTGGTVKFGMPTNAGSQMTKGVEMLYNRVALPGLGIRRLCIAANNIDNEGYMQFDLFSDPVKRAKERAIQEAVISIKDRYGKNAILRGANLLDCSTLRERNMQIGGHRAGTG